MAAWHSGQGGARIQLEPEEEGAAVLRALLDLLGAAGVEARGRLASVRGRRLHWLDAGPRSAAGIEGASASPPLLLLHGAGGGCGNWFGVLAELSADRRVLAPDLPGFGLSEALGRSSSRGSRSAEGLSRALADHLLAWLDQAGVERCSVAGTSFGGLLALRLALLAPERVSRLALIDSVGLGRELPRLIRWAAVLRLASLAGRGGRRVSGWVFRRFMVGDAERIPARVRGPLLRYLRASGRAGGDAALARFLPRFCDVRGQCEVLSTEELASVSAPVLLLWGREDRMLPLSHARSAAARLPRARLVIIEESGHSPNWEAPEALVAELRPFLAEQRPSP